MSPTRLLVYRNTDVILSMTSPTKAFNIQQMDDPAIASIGPSAGGMGKRGGGFGFGEGFGYGGGIGAGRGMGRVGRNIGCAESFLSVSANQADLFL